MRDKTHIEFVEKWAEFVRDNPGKWKKEHTEFIDSQFQKHDETIKRLLKTKNGRKKIIELYGIKNPKGYSFLS